MKNKIIYIVILCGILFPIALQAQNPSINLQKYWKYRERLEYFVVPGELEGQSICTGIRNIRGTANLDQGQNAVYHGYYLGVLATEYRLLEDYSLDSKKSARELYYALMQYINYMDKCENNWGQNDVFDGFFIRVAIPSDYVDSFPQFNNGLLPNSNFFNFTPGHPLYVNSSNNMNDVECMSQDESIGLLMGLALVRRCLPDTDIIVYDDNNNPLCTANLNEIACDIANNIITYIHDGQGVKNWKIYKPDGTRVAEVNGGNSFFYGKGFTKASEYFGLDPHRCNYNALQSTIWSSLKSFSDVYSGWMTADLAVIGNSWGNNTDKGIYKVTRDFEWDPFYLMLYEFLQNESSEYIDHSLLKQMINSAPCYGPYNFYIENTQYAPFGTSWVSSHKFWHSYEDQTLGQGSWFSGIYSGTDFMLLYNLYHLLYPSECAQYTTNPSMSSNNNFPFVFSNTFVEVGSSRNPIEMSSIDTIFVSGKVLDYTPPADTNYPGDVVYKSAKHIQFLPGFKAYFGSQMVAQIDDNNCIGYHFIDQGNMMKKVDIEENDSIEITINTQKLSNDTSQNLLLYPNPTTNNLSLEFFPLTTGKANLEIFDYSGKSIIKKEAKIKKGEKFSQNINVESLNNGSYLLIISINEQQWTCIFVKE